MSLGVKDGWLKLGRLVRVHWSAPIGVLVWTGGEISLLRLAAFVAMILVHELGHAIMIHLTRGRVTAITLHAMGGECAWKGDPTPIERAMIAWGGVWAQMLLALATWLAVDHLPRGLVEMFIGYNLFNAACNLIPVAPLDGARAWRLFPLVRSWLEEHQLRRRPRKVRAL